MIIAKGRMAPKFCLSKDFNFVEEMTAIWAKKKEGSHLRKKVFHIGLGPKIGS